MSKIMAIDYGDVRIGLSLSNTNLLMAHPVNYINHLPSVKKTINEIIKMAVSNQVHQIVVGLPKNMNGEIGERGQITLEFVKRLEKKIAGENLGISIVVCDERMSTMLANRLMNESSVKKSKKKDIVDSLAATVILQSYLDSLKKE